MNSLRLHAEVLSSRVHTLAFSRQMASLRSFARSLSGLTRCKTPKLLSLGMGARRMVGWAVSPPWMRWNRWRALCGLGIVGEKSELFPA